MNKRLFIAGAFFLIAAPAILANPVDRRALGGFAFPPLVVEALVIAGILAWRKFRFSRVFLAWLPVTLVTWWYMEGGLRLLLEMYEGFALNYDLTILLSEIAVVLVEAWVIARMAESPFFRKAPAPFPYLWALGISAAGNTASFAIGLLFT